MDDETTDVDIPNPMICDSAKDIISGNIAD